MGGAWLSHRLNFKDDVIHKIEIAHKVEQGAFIVKKFVRLALLKEVECSFGRYVKTLCQKAADASYFHPKLRIS